MGRRPPGALEPGGRALTRAEQRNASATGLPTPIGAGWWARTDLDRREQTVASTVVLRELLRRGTRTVERADNVAVDVRDEDDCLELLRRMAKRHGLKPTDCEINVKTGRHNKTYRM